MSLHVVAGAGSTGSRTALLLAEAGERVRLISRRGLGPDHPLIDKVVGDTSDADRLAALTAGALTLINTTWPAYDRWPTDFPPIAESVLAAAERTGANYVSLSNTYGYGRVDGPMTEDLPMSPVAVKGAVRARMWLDAKAAHEAGRVRVAEVRASDYLGRDAGSVFNFLVTRNVLAGEPAGYPGDPDVPKSWSYVDDVALTLATVARDERSWGRAWHVPSTVMSLRDVVERLATLTESPAPQLVPMSRTDLAWAGADDPVMAELIEMFYSLEHPDVFDSALTQRTFDLSPTPIDTVLADTARFGTY
ncbi:NAD-dependent epimerase/dehydratase family protein [Nocardia puris]|uniref:Nucleoside-diphosphate-sugar epimerase n=1 Tax=Nocardia puris TaxID=208602 RepID=A0A366DAA8_9NOCA|nr:NAD-dependent epimerase/dehydratase family protein [Nocardia puris]MBF6211701.1 NAD-dependent epimerase/dehydratase family protein [Nocardia puris]MBF6365705.1 NAD-dependent epimerase/dehydratase family protein [Nocardia puris]MBF6460653.1 NAD-dependent epimerase/dehydratase family protein [Nocardia puris]RBO86875.1 nucleoside-diphosphate-sugar epimerase [Nocardia puris]